MREELLINTLSPFVAAHFQDTSRLKMIRGARAQNWARFDIKTGQPLGNEVTFTDPLIMIDGLGIGTPETLYCMEMAQREIPLGEEMRP